MLRLLLSSVLSAYFQPVFGLHFYFMLWTSLWQSRLLFLFLLNSCLLSVFINRCEFFDFMVILFICCQGHFLLCHFFFTASVTTLLNSLLDSITDHIQWSLSLLSGTINKHNLELCTLHHFIITLNPVRKIWVFFDLIILFLALRPLNISNSDSSSYPFLVS